MQLTEHEFIEELKGLGLEWTLGSYRPGELRCANGKCPITAVAFGRGGVFNLSAYDEAAAFLGLDEITAMHIVDAADLSTDGYSHYIRHQLVSACGGLR